MDILRLISGAFVAILLFGCGQGTAEIPVPTETAPAAAISAEQALRAVLSSPGVNGSPLYSIFPQSVGTAACRIPQGGPLVVLLDGTCESRAEPAGTGWVVSFIETWHADSFHYHDDPASGQLSHTWWFRVDSAGGITDQGNFGNFPPQSVA